MARLRSNIGKFSKHAEITITKKLEKQTKDLVANMSDRIESELLNKYKQNVLLSFAPRSSQGQSVLEYNKRASEKDRADREQGITNSRAHRQKLTYHHTGLFLDSITTKRITDDLGRTTIQVSIEELTYPDPSGVKTQPRTTVDVYEYLTAPNGTQGGGYYPSGKDGNKIIYSYNYPTPHHLFEEQTREQMKGYLETLQNDIKAGRYRTRKRR